MCIFKLSIVHIRKRNLIDAHVNHVDVDGSDGGAAFDYDADSVVVGCVNVQI